MPTQPRYHGRHQLNRHPDGLEKCIGCELCAWACPADAIYVEGASNTPDAQFSPGERYGRVYQINYLRCIFCGLCIEACPTRALTMTNEYELAGPSRAGLIYEKQDLLAPMLPGMLGAPHPMVAGTEDTCYYRGEVTRRDARAGRLGREHRPRRPTLASFGVTPARPTTAERRRPPTVTVMIALLRARRSRARAAGGAATPLLGGGETVLFLVLAPLMVLASLGLLFVKKAVHAASLVAS